MFFIVEGELTIFAPDNKTVAETLTKGNFVGEMALLNKSKRKCNVFASTYCLLYTLNRGDFEDILRFHPEIASAVRRADRDRSRKLT